MLAQLLLTSGLAVLPAAERHAEFLAETATRSRTATSELRLAQGPAGGPPPMPPQPPAMDRPPGLPPGPPFLRGLDLTDAQQDKVFAVLHSQMPAARERMRDVQQARRQLDELTRSERFDDARARALADTIAHATADLDLLRARSEAQIWQVLTAEQRLRASEAPPPPHGGPGPHARDPRGPR